MLEVGHTAPRFTLPGSNGEDVEQYSLTDATDTGAVVLLFYPFDFSPVCTAELCEFRDSELLTFTRDLDVYGISTDSAFAHEEFIQANNLPFPLLSDHAGQVSEQYGVLADNVAGHERVSKRAVFVIDDEQMIRYAWKTEYVMNDPDISEVYEHVQEMESISLAPA